MAQPAKKRSKASTSATAGEIGVKITPFGPKPEEMQALAKTVTQHRAVRALLEGTRHRLLRIEAIYLDQEAKLVRPKPPSHFRAIFFDYTNNRTVLATGALAKPVTLEVTESALQPRPSDDEFADAVSTVMANPEFKIALREQRLVPYRPMPPLVGEELPDGRVARTIAVGLMPREGMQGHEIVGVNMSEREVIRFAPSARGRAPETSAAHNPICGLPDANQSTASSVAASAWVVKSENCWEFWRRGDALGGACRGRRRPRSRGRAPA
jgi:hypothetical protein